MPLPWGKIAIGLLIAIVSFGAALWALDVLWPGPKDRRVDESGEVTDALWAGGSNDSALVQSATECALRMRFYPALQSGQPVPVWCRQRFDFGGGKPEGR